MRRIKVSVVVLTKNEEKNIKECLESLAWCDEIIIIDDYSEDGTIRVIEEIGEIREKVKIFSRKLEGDFSAQRNFGLEKASGDWILFVDADERVTPELAKEIKQKIRHSGESEGRLQNRFWTSQNDEEEYDGFFIKRRDFLFGKWLKYGEIRDISFIRLIRKNKGRWTRRVHETMGELGELGELGAPLLHYPHQTISEFLEKINFYTDLNAKELYQKTSLARGGLARLKFEIVAYPLAKFVKNYFLKLGFLDGTAGFVQAMMMSFHSFLSRGKLWEMIDKIKHD